VKEEMKKTNREEIKEDIRTNQVKTDTTIKEMNEEVTTRMEPRIDGNNRSLRSFEVFSSPGWISTKPGQRPFRRNNCQDGRPSGKNGSHCEFLTKRVYGLPRSDGGLSGEQGANLRSGA
jgi:hypothetical protein